jgi:hypothetical protein
VLTSFDTTCYPLFGFVENSIRIPFSSPVIWPVNGSSSVVFKTSDFWSIFGGTNLLTSIQATEPEHKLSVTNPYLYC